MACKRSAATILHDMRKFFERFRIDKLEHRAGSHGIPSPLSKLAIGTYRGPRVVRSGLTVTSPVFALCGLPAGCGLADLWVRVYCIDAFDGIVHRAPDACFDFYIDDLTVSAEAESDEAVLRIIMPATAILIDAVIHDIDSEIDFEFVELLMAKRAAR